jgi:superfamily II DNA or RNA helicase
VRFEKLWNGEISDKWKIIDLPTAVKDKIITDFAPDLFPTDLEVLGNENSSGLRDYQLEALNQWVKADRRGILEMATGTGKTRTAKACFESCLSLGNLLTIVVVPYQHIGDQWAKELIEFSPLVISDNWRKKISEVHTEVALGRISNLTLIVVKNTAGTEDFTSKLRQISEEFNNILIIGDEVHWLGANEFQSSLIPFANYRLGLSATPVRYFDEEGTDVLIDYFGGTVYKLSLKEALKITDEKGQAILCPYEYNPKFVSLSKSELEEYRLLSGKINKLSFMQDDYDVRKQLTLLRNQRSAIAKKAESKIPAFRRLMDELPKPLKQCIVYCADTSQLQQVAEIMHELKIDTQQITGDESTSKSDKWDGMNEREFILKNFASEKLGVLLAIRCLDEGVDIPSASMGIILASSGNPKEFIQRRGRLMRFFKEKEKATIYDFCVLPMSKDDPVSDLNLVKVELKRISEFADDAINRSEVLKVVDSQMAEV